MGFKLTLHCTNKDNFLVSLPFPDKYFQKVKFDCVDDGFHTNRRNLDVAGIYACTERSCKGYYIGQFLKGNPVFWNKIC